jgi:mannitol/fructose-specific phosphotransferase system IIA component (Ntr-type)
VGYARRDDLIVLGAPNYWRVLHQFEGSTPDLVAKALPNPLLMLLSPRASHLRLGDIFWEEMVRVDMAPRDRREALGMLIEVLAEHGQIPPPWKERVLERALARESVLSTATDCETALPHVTIPDFSGTIGCFGICPRGVAFGDTEGQLTRFIFLLVTAPHAYGEYLNVLALIARLVMSQATRERLLACRSAAEVSAILAAGGCGPGL